MCVCEGLAQCTCLLFAHARFCSIKQWDSEWWTLFELEINESEGDDRQTTPLLHLMLAWRHPGKQDAASGLRSTHFCIGTSPWHTNTTGVGGVKGLGCKPTAEPLLQQFKYKDKRSRPRSRARNKETPRRKTTRSLSWKSSLISSNRPLVSFRFWNYTDKVNERNLATPAKQCGRMCVKVEQMWRTYSPILWLGKQSLHCNIKTNLEFSAVAACVTTLRK